MLVGEMNRGEGDGCGRVASDRFGEYLRYGNTRELATNGGSLLGVGDDPAIALGEDGNEAGDGFAKHGVATGDIQELLGSAHTAARPEACAATAREQDGASRKIAATS